MLLREQPTMLIIGCDLHTRFQMIAYVEMATGGMITCRLEHENCEARKFYASLGEKAMVGTSKLLRAKSTPTHVRKPAR